MSEPPQQQHPKQQPASGAVPERATAPLLLALVAVQVCLHSAMAGLRLAAPLMMLRQGPTPWWSAEAAAGLLLGLFAAAPVFLVVPAGRWVDRRGYHRPMRATVVMGLLAGLCAVPTVAIHQHGGPLAALWQWPLLVLSATLAGTSGNVGLIAMQRSAGRLVEGQDGSAQGRSGELRRIFSWLGLAPALGNMIGPALAGLLIDGLGFAACFALIGLLPLGAAYGARRVPPDDPSRRVTAPEPPPSLSAATAAAPTLSVPQGAAAARPRSVMDLLRLPGLASLLLLNWFFSTSWDLHAFLVPLLGHERGLSASAIGGVLGLFALSVAGVRLLIPLVAQHLQERWVLAGTMAVAAAVFAVYPAMQTAWQMSLCALTLGLALGAVQPMIMTALHHCAPPDRQGEAIALRSAVINSSSTLLPMAFGLIGAAVGPTLLFRGMTAVLLLVGLPLAWRWRPQAVQG